MSDESVEPAEVALAVEMYVDRELHDAEKFANRQPLDGSGVYSLHTLAAALYAMGWRAGHMTGYDSASRSDRRKHQAQMAELRAALSVPAAEATATEPDREARP